ncbi:hypothetical protein QAD02_005419 [Eretmocerus hayati]|uniref:Uncharacterized protein n=1 Tax=Eretmocerus hayati TaxID=131215 RepID=A0ACC2NV93_9HYME|nr:hypothetical protein QAD02_005419 [Eretmocerus hayati]
MWSLSEVRTRPYADPAKLLGKKRGTGARAFLGCGLSPRSAHSHQDGLLERRKAEGTRESPSVVQPRYDHLGSPAAFACLSARYHQPTVEPSAHPEVESDLDLRANFSDTFDIHYYAAREIAWSLIAEKADNFKVFIYHANINRGEIISLTNNRKALAFRDKISPTTFFSFSDKIVSILKSVAEKACENLYLRTLLLKTPEGDVYLNLNTLYPSPLLPCPLAIISETWLNCPSLLVKELDALLQKLNDHGLNPKTENINLSIEAIRAWEYNLREHMYLAPTDRNKKQGNWTVLPNPKRRKTAERIAKRYSKNFLAKHGRQVVFTWEEVYRRSEEEVFQSYLSREYYNFSTTGPQQAAPQPLGPTDPRLSADPRIRRRLEFPQPVNANVQLTRPQAVQQNLLTPPTTPVIEHPYCMFPRPPTPPRNVTAQSDDGRPAVVRTHLPALKFDVVVGELENLPSPPRKRARVSRTIGFPPLVKEVEGSTVEFPPLVKKVESSTVNLKCERCAANDTNNICIDCIRVRFPSLLL